MPLSVPWAQLLPRTHSEGNHMSNYQEVAKLELQLRLLCREHGVNMIQDLPPEPFQKAMAIQSQIDTLKREQTEVLAERGRKGLAKALAGVTARKEARIEAYRRELERQGGLYGAQARRIAREMGISLTAAASYLKVLRVRDKAGEHSCPVCRQPLPDCSVIPPEARANGGTR